MGFFSQQHLSRLPFPLPGDLLEPGIESASPALQRVLCCWATRKPRSWFKSSKPCISPSSNCIMLHCIIISGTCLCHSPTHPKREKSIYLMCPGHSTMTSTLNISSENICWLRGQSRKGKSHINSSSPLITTFIIGKAGQITNLMIIYLSGSPRHLLYRCMKIRENILK